MARGSAKRGGFGRFIVRGVVVGAALMVVNRLIEKPQPSLVAATPRGRLQLDGPPHGGLVARGDANLDGAGLIFTIRRVCEEIAKDRVLSVAGGLTFFCLLALFPALSAIVSVFGLFADPQQVAQDLGSFTALLPHDAAQILMDQARAISAAGPVKLSWAVVLALVLALWSANGGTKALIAALNVAYGVAEDRKFLRRNALSLAATLGAIAAGLVLLAAVALLPRLLDLIWLGALTESLILLGRWPAIFLIMLGFLALSYHFAPNRPEARWRWVTPGAVLAAAGLVAFSLVFDGYVQNLGTFNRTYGALGAVVALMTWMWLSATLVLIGAELNAELDRQSVAANKKGPAAPSAAAPAQAAR